MTKSIIEHFLSFARYIFFEVISPKFNAAAFKNLVDYEYIILEKIAYSFEILSSNYLKLYDELIEKEISMAKITDDTNVLVIGCGSLPATTALIGLKIKANIVSIDCDAKAIKKAKIFLEKLNLKSNTTIEYADGLTYPIDKFDVIFVLYGVKKQKELLENLSQKIGKSKKIIYRTNQDSLDQLVGGTEFLSNLFSIDASFGSESIYTSISYLLTKK